MRVSGNLRFASSRLIICTLFLCALAAQAQTDPLPSWNDGAAKQAIIKFVHATTDQASPNYVPPDQRFDTFDQDGTAWVEHPMYTEMIFAFDRVRELAPQHPEWKTSEPFKSIIAGDQAAMSKFTGKEF